MSNNLVATGLVLSGLFVSSTVLAATQAVFPTQTGFEVSPEDTVEFTVNYSSSSPQDTTGLGLKLYYDSSKLTLLSVSDVFAKDKIAQSDGDDTSNGDGNNATDKKINAAWAGLSGNWPGATAGDTNLLTVSFKVAPNFSSATSIGFTGDASAGNTFSATPVTIMPKVVEVDTTPPTITAPADVAVEARANKTTVTTTDLGFPTVTDDKDPSPVVSFVPTAPLALGVHTITWSAKDNANNQATAEQTVTIIDTTAPQIQAPGDLSISATGTSTSVDVGTATATDLVDGSVTVTSDSTGSFSTGTHTVTWTAKDASNNNATATQTIVVVDGDGPTVTAPADITLEATGATTSVNIGNATATDVIDGTLTATASAQGPFSVGVHTVTWTATDSANNSATATQTITITDSTTPEVTSQDLLKVTATGVRTIIDNFHIAATDIVDGTITPTAFVVVNGSEQALPSAGLVSGRHQLIWKATDNANNTLTVNQVVEITPLVNFVASQAASAGDTVTVNVELTGKAVTYPVKIPYSIDTSVSTVNNDGSDHNATNGEITIESGTSGSFSFKVADNPALNGSGQGDLVFTLGSAINAVAGASKSHKVSISSENIAPVVNMSMTQSSQQVSVVTKDAGNVLVTATASDSESQTLTYDWSQSNAALNDVSSEAEVFEFDPSGLTVGGYGVVVTVKDNGSPVKQTTVNTNFIVKAGSVPVIDTDGDGVEDSKDNVAEPNRLAADEGGSDTFILESEAGTKLQLGDVALEQGQNAASVDIAGLPEIPDDYKESTLEIYDFEITGVAQGSSTLIVLPQHNAIPEKAVYLKSDGSSWKPFVEDQNNAIYSAQKISNGVCPSTGDSKYKSGLKQGDYCVQLEIEDGGSNDTDGLVNGAVADPGVVVGTKSVATGGGGGAISWLLLPFMLLLGVVEKFLKRSSRWLSVFTYL